MVRGRPKKEKTEEEPEEEIEEQFEKAKTLSIKQELIRDKERLQKELDILNQEEMQKEFMKNADKRLTYVEEMVRLNREYLLEHNKMLKSLEEVCQALIKEEK